MLTLLKNAANTTYTENMGVTYATSGSDCLDLFATIGALRRESESEVVIRFDRAWAEDADLAIKTMFYARDIRGGLGERRVFRVLLRHIGNTYAASAKKNIEHIAEYGRFDDILALFRTRCEAEALAYLKTQFESDMKALESGGGKVSLLGKWLPSVNASNTEAVLMGKRVARALGLNDKQYRKALTALRAEIRILENNLRERDYSFDYSKQPSKAMLKYRKAFYRNDKERYEAFLDAVCKGEAKLNVSTLLPYEIITPLISAAPSDDDCRSLDATWNAQKDFTNGENALVVVDGSASMYMQAKPIPATVALSLGIYFAERNTGMFHNHFITFSEKPQLVEIKGANIAEKVRYCEGYNEVANTDIKKVFSLILKTAVRNNLPQSELPSTLYIISDMEFDACAENAEISNFENAKMSYSGYGYSLPRVVFWNMASRNRQQPVTVNEQGVALVSGASPRVFAMIKAGALTPMAFMLETLSASRYNKITP